MLVLTRKVGERVLIGQDIEITVVSVRGDHVRLGIAAPQRVPVVRSELLDQVRRENIAAARAASLAGAPPHPGAVRPTREFKSSGRTADTSTDAAPASAGHRRTERRHAQQ